MCRIDLTFGNTDNSSWSYGFIKPSLGIFDPFNLYILDVRYGKSFVFLANAWDYHLERVLCVEIMFVWKSLLGQVSPCSSWMLANLRASEKGPMLLLWRHFWGLGRRREKGEELREPGRWGGVRVRLNCVLRFLPWTHKLFLKSLNPWTPCCTFPFSFSDA